MIELEEIGVLEAAVLIVRTRRGIRFFTGFGKDGRLQTVWSFAGAMLFVTNEDKGKSHIERRVRRKGYDCAWLEFVLNKYSALLVEGEPSPVETSAKLLLHPAKETKATVAQDRQTTIEDFITDKELRDICFGHLRSQKHEVSDWVYAQCEEELAEEADYTRSQGESGLRF